MNKPGTNQSPHKAMAEAFRLRWRAKLAPYPAPIRAAGFTLIELSIVLVIIGLIVGGVLVGNDLIEAAKLRATVSQKAEFNSAVNTFRVKYNGIPGDLKNAAQFGFAAPHQNPAAGVTLGNRILESSNGAIQASALVAGYETTYFWYHLSEAGLISETITLPPVGTLGTKSTEQLKEHFPATQLNNGSMWIPFSVSGKNYFGIWQLNSQTYSFENEYKLTPTQAYGIDSKVDDGKATTGNIITALKHNFQLHITPGDNATCRNGDEYRVGSDANADNFTCALMIEAGF